MADNCGSSCSVDVRRIENGYVTRTSRCEEGKYSSSESFSREAPKLPEMAPRERTSAGRETLRDAIKSLK